MTKRWKNDELERLPTDPSPRWVQTRIHLRGPLGMVLHGAAGLVMLVSRSRHSGRGRDRSEARTRAGAQSACSLKILSKKRKKKRKTLLAAARRSLRRVRMLQTMTLIAGRSLWFVANGRDRNSSFHLFRRPPRGLQGSKWMPRQRVFLRRHRQQSVSSIFPRFHHLPRPTNAPSRSPFPVQPRLRRRSIGRHLVMATRRPPLPRLDSRTRSGGLHHSSDYQPLTWTSKYKSYLPLRLLEIHLHFLLSAPSRPRPLSHPRPFSR